MVKRTELMKQLLCYDLFTIHREKPTFPGNGLSELMSCFHESDIRLEETEEILERMICAFPDRKSVCETAQLMKPVNLTKYLLESGRVVPRENGGYEVAGYSLRWEEFLSDSRLNPDNVVIQAEFLENLALVDKSATIGLFRIWLDALSHLEFIMESLWNAQVDRQFSDKSFSLEVPMVYYHGLYRRLAKDAAKNFLFVLELRDQCVQPLFVSLNPLDMYRLCRICEDEERRGLGADRAVINRDLLGKIAEKGMHYYACVHQTLGNSFDLEEKLDNMEKVTLAAQTPVLRRNATKELDILIHKLLNREMSHFGLAGHILRINRFSFKRGEQVDQNVVHFLEEYFGRLKQLMDQVVKDPLSGREHTDVRDVYALYLKWIEEMKQREAPEESAPVKTEPIKYEPVKKAPPAPKTESISSPKPTEKKPSEEKPMAKKETPKKETPKKEEKPEEKKPEKQVSRPLCFIKGGIALALLLFLLFAPAAAFLWTEEAMVIVKIAVVLICAVLGAVIGNFSGFFSGGIGGAVAMWVLPYFIELVVLVKIVLVLVLGGFSLYQIIVGLGTKKEKKS